MCATVSAMPTAFPLQVPLPPLPGSFNAATSNAAFIGLRRPVGIELVAADYATADFHRSVIGAIAYLMVSPTSYYMSLLDRHGTRREM